MTIRYWLERDGAALKVMMLDFLTEHYEIGGDFKPTELNAERLVRLGLDAAGRKEPALLAVEDGKIIGLNLWYATDIGLETRERVLLGFCTYVLPERRRQRVANTLRASAVAIGYVAGFTRVEGTVIHAEGMSSVRASGGRPVGTLMRGELEKLIFLVPPKPDANAHDFDTDASLWH